MILLLCSLSSFAADKIAVSSSLVFKISKTIISDIKKKNPAFMQGL